MPGSLLEGGDFDKIGNQQSKGGSKSAKTIALISAGAVLALAAAVIYWPRPAPKSNAPATIQQLPLEDQEAHKKQQQINERRMKTGELTIGDS